MAEKMRVNMTVFLICADLILVGGLIAVLKRDGQDVALSCEASLCAPDEPMARPTPHPEVLPVLLDSQALTRGSEGVGRRYPQTPASCGGSVQRPLHGISSIGLTNRDDKCGTNCGGNQGKNVPQDRQYVARFPETGEYFSLEINVASGTLPKALRKQLADRAEWVYDAYRGLLPKESLNRVDMHLVVHNQRSDYEAVRDRYVGRGASNAPGFFIVSDNRVEMLRQGNRVETLKIMVHEVAHVINNQLFGPLPRWLNEGLATYIDALDTDRQRPTTAAERLRLIKKQVGVPLLEQVGVQRLLVTGNTSWGREKGAIYYPLSQLLTTYLLQPENHGFVGPFFRYLSISKCNEVDIPGYMESHYPGGITGLEADFRQWLHGDD